MILAFTGHRPQDLGGGYEDTSHHWQVRKAIRKQIEALTPTWAISGMALGVDQWAAEICTELGIPWTAAIPFVGQEAVWPDKSKRIYKGLLKFAHSQVICSPGGYAVEKMQIRNEWLVNQCQHLLAVWDGSPGGTANCVAYAQAIKKPITFINPEEI